MNIVIPMAGRGSRFTEAGVSVPKPLIDVRGRPMYSWAVDGLPLDLAKRLIFVCLDEHLRERDLADDVQRRYGHLDPVIVPLDHVTEGQACTVLEARSWIDNDDPLVIFNADTHCPSRLGEALAQLGPEVDGVLGVFQAPGDRWSFARTDESGRVVEVAEKRRISELACTGLYHFSRGQDFVRHADAAVAGNDRVNGEFYVAPLYNRMIAEDADVRTVEAPEVWVLGTPEELDNFERCYP